MRVVVVVPMVVVVVMVMVVVPRQNKLDSEQPHLTTRFLNRHRAKECKLDEIMHMNAYMFYAYVNMYLQVLRICVCM